MAWSFLIKLGIMIVTFIIGRLLTPRPRGPTLKPGEFGPPDSTEGKPLPVVFGTCQVTPNVAWFGDVKAVPVKKKKETIGYAYFAGMLLSLCWGQIDELLDILIDNSKSMQRQGTQRKLTGFVGFTPQYQNVTPLTPMLPFLRPVNGLKTQFDIYLPALFGGRDQGGGVTGLVDFQWGTSAQAANDYLITHFGTVATSQYKKRCYAVLRQVNLGNSPYLRPMNFVVRRCPNNVGTASEAVIQSYHANPAEIIYECTTNTDWGVGRSPSTIDFASFQTACTTLKAENFGLSGLFKGESSAEETIGEVLRHIDGLLFVHPRSGLLTLKLVRNDYSVGSLPLLDPSNVTDCKPFARASWNELLNEVHVKYTKYDFAPAPTGTGLFREASVPAQNLAARQGAGEIRSEEFDFSMIGDDALAQFVADRTCKQTSLPLAKTTLVGDRTLAQYVSGDVIKVSWPKYGISNLVMRVLSTDYGTLEDGKVEVIVAQDIFGLSAAIYTPPSTSWTNPTVANISEEFNVDVQIVETDAQGTVRLVIDDVQQRVSTVEFNTKSGTAAESGWVTDSTIPYEGTVVRVAIYDSSIKWRVNGTDPSGNPTILEEGEEIFGPTTGPTMPALALSADAIGNVDVIASVDGSVTSVKIAASKIAYPSDTTVRAATADTAAPFEALDILNLAVGETAYVGAFAYNAAGSESQKGINAYTRGGGTSGGSVKLAEVAVPFFMLDDGTGVITNAPSAATELFGDTKRRAVVNLAGYEQVRVSVVVQVAGLAGTKVAIQYSTNSGGAWSYLNAVGSGPTAPLDVAGLQGGPYLSIDPAARREVWLRAVSVGGDGVADPVIGNLLVALVPRAGADTPPGTPHAMDDEFDGPTRNAIWTEQNWGGGSSDTYVGSRIALKSGTTGVAEWRVLTQPLQNGRYVLGLGSMLGRYQNFQQCGLLLRESATSKMEIAGWTYNNAIKREITKWTNFNTFAGTPNPLQAATIGMAESYLYVDYDGTDIKWGFSFDGHHIFFDEVHAGALFFTTAPDQIGIGVRNNSAGEAFLVADFFRKIA